MVCRGYGSWGLGVGLTKTSISTLTKGLYGIMVLTIVLTANASTFLVQLFWLVALSALSSTQVDQTLPA